LDERDAAILATIRRLFAEREAVLVLAFRTSESFRAVCSDYVACARALARWEQSGSEEAPLRATEYAELLEELRRDLECQIGPRPE